MAGNLGVSMTAQIHSSLNPYSIMRDCLGSCSACFHC
jgi:hypothetical protein